MMFRLDEDAIVLWVEGGGGRGDEPRSCGCQMSAAGWLSRVSR